MPDLSIHGVIVALANYMAGNPLNLARTGSAIALWAMEFEEARSAATWSVVRPYTGRLDQLLVPTLAVQVYTVSNEDVAASINRASQLAGRLRDSLGRPVRELAIAGFVVKGVRALSLPGKIGTDAKGRAEIVFNFDLSYLPA